jgi:hypothetical protein
LLDTISGSGGATSGKVVSKFDGPPGNNTSMVIVEGVSYKWSYGNPGNRSEGECNNCLIDSLRQCLGIETDRKKVREDLVREFRNKPDRDRAQVTHMSYLDIESHWRAILQSIFKHNTSNSPTECDLDEYCIIALYATNKDQGWTNDNLDARYRLVVLNTSDMHFDAYLPSQSSSSASSGI